MVLKLRQPVRDEGEMEPGGVGDETQQVMCVGGRQMEPASEWDWNWLMKGLKSGWNLGGLENVKVREAKEREKNIVGCRFTIGL